MVNIQESSVENLSFGSSSSTSAGAGPSSKSKIIAPFKYQPYQPYRKLSVEELIDALADPHKRGSTILLLCKIKDNHENMGPMLWKSDGTIFALLQEITNIYYYISTPHLTENMSNQACNALALLQCVASHPETRWQFIKADLAEYLYPLITITEKEKPYEFLRVTSLGVIGSLLKDDDTKAVEYLLEGEIIPKCLVCLEVGNLLTKTVAVFILERLLTIGDRGLDFCCASAERFYSITRVLAQKVEELADKPCKRLLKHIIYCYSRLAENPRACDCLDWCLPDRFTDLTFLQQIINDPTAISWVHALVHNVSGGHSTKKLKPTGELFGSSDKGKNVIETPMLTWDK